MNQNKANSHSPHLRAADTDLRSFQLTWSVLDRLTQRGRPFFPSHTYATYTCCTLRAWIEIWWNHLKCCVQHILMMQSWSCRGNIYPTCRPTYFAKLTCLNRIEHETSTEHAKDPWNRRIIWILMNHRRRGSSCSPLFHQIWKIKAGSDIMHWGCQLSCGVKRKWCNVVPMTKTRKSKKKTQSSVKKQACTKEGVPRCLYTS